MSPRLDGVHYWLGLDLRGLFVAIVVDYASTHVDTFEPIPEDGLEMLE